MSIPATVDNGVTLALVLENGQTGLYPRAEIYDGASLEATIDLTDLGKGRYEGSWTPTVVGTFTALFSVFQDAGYSVELTPLVISREAEQIFVSQSGTDDLAAMLVRLLGLNHENSFIDNCTYDSNSMLLSARLRIFDDKSNVPTSGGGSETTGLVATYTIESSHITANRMATYRMVKE